MLSDKNIIIVGKKALCLIFVFLLSINSFAAVVSDNDGSAFVTKAEFEQLKNDFNEQIDRYNKSIDGKIDGKIANYLDGLNIKLREDLDRLLDENGIYGKKWLLHWKSDTDAKRINIDYAYVNLSSTLNCFMSQVSNGRYYGGTYSWSNWHDGREDNPIDPFNIALKYKYKDGTNWRYSLYYEKVKNDLQLNWFFQFPLNDSNWAGGVNSSWELMNLLRLNENDLKQGQLTNKIATYYRYYDWIWECWSVWKEAYFTMRYTESDTDQFVIFPFSNAYEKIWDKDDNTLDLGFTDENSKTTTRSWGAPGPTPDGYPDLYRNPGTININTNNKIWCPWQLMTDSVPLKDREIKNLTDINKNNYAFKNGIVVGTIPSYTAEMDLTAKFKVSQAGTVYMYVGDSRIDNWTTTDFKGKKVDITDTSKEYEIKYEYVKKDQSIWMLYKPIITSATKNLFLTNLYIEK